MNDTAQVVFPSPPQPQYPGGCTLEPAPFALDFLVKWRADLRVGSETYRNAVVLDVLREVVRDPAAFGVSAPEAGRAKDRFLTLAGQVLEREGGNRAWLEREFQR